MKELTIGTLIAVFEEMFGAVLFWVMAAAAIAVTLVYLFVLIRDRSISWKKFLLAQLSMPFGAVIAVLFVQVMTNSSFSDIGGPVDVIVLLGVALVGAVGMAICVYALESLLGTKRTTAEDFIWRDREDRRAQSRNPNAMKPKESHS